MASRMTACLRSSAASNVAAGPLSLQPRGACPDAEQAGVQCTPIRLQHFRPRLCGRAEGATPWQHFLTDGRAPSSEPRISISLAHAVHAHCAEGCKPPPRKHGQCARTAQGMTLFSTASRRSKSPRFDDDRAMRSANPARQHEAGSRRSLFNEASGYAVCFPTITWKRGCAKMSVMVQSCCIASPEALLSLPNAQQ